MFCVKLVTVVPIRETHGEKAMHPIKTVKSSPTRDNSFELSCQGLIGLFKGTDVPTYVGRYAKGCQPVVNVP